MDTLTDAGDYFEDTFKGLLWIETRLSGASFEECELADVPVSGYVLGRSVHQFAPAIAALNDGEEMVNTWHGFD